jgi:hypothetical protein
VLVIALGTHSICTGLGAKIKKVMLKIKKYRK